MEESHADGRVLGNPHSARNAVVETIVEEQRVIRILEAILHISRRECPGRPAVTGLTVPAVATERLGPKQPSALISCAR